MTSYLRKAREAEKLQKLTKDPQVKAAWERIAAGYLELAAMAARRER